ncbi:MAG: DUF4407 domain-containing protein, partial [Octadecabacter sp.]
MAKTPKGNTEDSKIDTSEIDAVEVSEDANETAVTPVEIEEATVVEGDDVVEFTDVDEDEAFEDLADAEVEVDEAVDGSEVDLMPDDLEMEIVDDSVEDPVVETMPEPIVHDVVPQERAKSGGFGPTVFGGLIAGAIGYGIATFFPIGIGSGDIDAQLAAQADQISDLEAQIAAIPAPDLTPLQTQIADVTDQGAEQISALQSTIDALDARIVEVEKAPNADGTLSETALAAYQAELDQLRGELDEQQQSVMNSAAQAGADLAAAREEAARLEQEAIATAQAAANRAALNRISTAVETGAPFADALVGLEGADIPAALSDAAESGVATTAQLTQDFPAAARAALATARAEGVSGDAGGLGGFLRNQFDVRSTAPIEG